MENNNIAAIDACLDGWLKRNKDEAAVRAELTGLGVADADAAMTLHQQAAVALQRYKVLQQVQGVHNTYLAQRQLSRSATTQQPAKVIKLSPLKWAMRIAAVLILALGVSFGYQYVSNSPGQLYNELYSPYNPVVDRASGTMEPKNTIVSLYEAKNYQGIVDAYAQNPTGNIREQFFTGMAHSELGQYDKAATIFEQILASNKASGSRLYNDDAEYYLGLAYLKQGQCGKAYELLQAIRQDNNHTYRTAVSRWLLTRLNWLR
jgi:tetratricopeptide (TPR) repeat protein